MRRIGILIMLAFSPVFLFGQYGFITGRVFDKFGPISNATVNVKDSPYGTLTNGDGYFAFEIDTGYHELTVEITGYHKTERAILLINLDQKEVNFEMESALMDADVGIGSKSNVTQNQLDSPVPIDVIYGQDLINTGQSELSQALHQLLPSFYAVKQSADDGINTIDPISLRGLGPDQVLVLVNGKRRHKSAFLNVSDVFGKGTAGTDLNTIPLLAIDRIEILRDGASSQYGSDAIAGVINVVMKDQSFDPTIALYAGRTTEQDGSTEALSFNHGFRIKRRGFVNLTGAFVDQGAVNRGGAYTGPIFGDNRDNVPALRSRFFDRTGFPNQTIVELGNSQTQNASLWLNSSYELNEDMDFYTFGGISYRDGKVNELYRLPILEQQVVPIWYPFGFSPKLVTEINDRSIVLGVRGEVNNWFIDVSYGLGRNAFDLNVENSNNASLGVITPTASFVGAYKYFHDIISLDASRTFEAGPGQFDLAFGTEYRIEEYFLIDGEPESYIDGGDTTTTGLPRAAGMQGYFGILEDDALEEIRSNGSIYLEADYLLNKWSITGAVRYEEYSDFGENLNFKLATRYKFANQLLLRTSYSSGFKAPSLHQLFYQRVSNQLLDQELQSVVLINTESPISGTRLGLFGLEPEISESVSFGITSNINRNISLSIDAYETQITDRIGLVSRIDVNSDSFLQEALGEFDIQFLEFFANLVDTRTQGVDAVLAAQFSTDKIAFNVHSAFSLMQTRLMGDVKTLSGLQNVQFDLLDRSEISRIETYVPDTQWRNSLSATFSRFVLTLNHTRFGATEFLHEDDGDPSNWVLNQFTGQLESRDQEFDAKHIFGADLKAQIVPKLNLTVGGLNLTNQYPDRIKHSENTNLGVNPYSQNVRPFDLRGTYLYFRVDLTL